DEIPEELLSRTPLLKPEWVAIFKKIKEHPDSPAWNTSCGDRIASSDLPFIYNFKKDLYNRRSPSFYPEDSLLIHLSSLRNRVLHFQDALQNLRLEKDFFKIPPMSRNDLTGTLERIVPFDADLQRLIVNPTSGTSGHIIQAPNHPKAVGCYDIMLQYVLSRYGIDWQDSKNGLACILLCFQEKTITYATVHSLWDGAGYAKINLKDSRTWRKSSAPNAFIREMKPLILAGDPISFSAYLENGFSYSPRAFLSTALKMSPALRKELEAVYHAPVIELYSLNETGPIAYSCPQNPEVLHQLPMDIYIETIAESAEFGDGIGEITLSGGRNPYLPLLRYKTGDSALLDRSSCACGELSLQIKHLEGRKFVLFKNQSGQFINPIDISRIVRNYPMIQHRMLQKKDGSFVLEILPLGEDTESFFLGLREELLAVLGKKEKLEIIFNMKLGEDKKVIPYEIEE
ncbi:MAG: phenylacetate--CoA ligase family protein, partial [Leptospiraceae bacterium]|nr:phenylacetate--CoA ligase family protein [Leptospiraceae bacterium]